MCFSLNLLLLPQSLAAAATAVGPGDLSEAELVARYPAIAAAGVALLSLGLICDLYLLFRFARPSFSNGPAAAPRFKIGPQPWSIRDLWFATGALVLVMLAVDAPISLVLKLLHWDEDRALPWLLAIDMVSRLVILFGFVAFFRRRNIDWCQVFGFRRDSPLRAVGMGVAFFLAVLPPLVAVFALFSKFCHLVGIKEEPQPISDLLATSDSVAVVVLIAAFAVTIAPVFEEFFFRGFAYPPLKLRWGMWRAMLAVSAVFAAIHFHVPSLGPLFALAIGLGLAYELTGSLLAPITMHALFNATNVAMVLYVRAHP